MIRHIVRLSAVIGIALWLLPLDSVAKCKETVTIDSVAYPVGVWCGHRVDSADMADPAHLAKLPQELTFDDYRIYVRSEVRDALKKMAAAAKKAGVLLTVDSGFRSKRFQRQLIKRRLDSGETFASIIRSVAPPGYSEHHTGRALDFCPSAPAFAKSPAYTWLKANAARFGFTESMPEHKGSGSDIHWEPWHWLFTAE